MAERQHTCCSRLFCRLGDVDRTQLWKASWSDSLGAGATLFAWRAIIGAYIFCHYLYYYSYYVPSDYPWFEHLSYLTVWGWGFCWIFFILASIHTAVGIVKAKRTGYAKGPHYDRFSTFIVILFEIAFGLQCIVVPVYWGGVHDFAESQAGLLWFFDINVHFLGLIFLIVDIFLSRFPLVVQHFFWVFLFALFYGIWNIIYTFADHKLYSILTWTDAMSYIWFIIAIVALVLLWFAGFGCTKCRDSCLISKGRRSSVAPGCDGCGTCCVPNTATAVTRDERLIYGHSLTGAGKSDTSPMVVSSGPRSHGDVELGRTQGYN